MLEKSENARVRPEGSDDPPAPRRPADAVVPDTPPRADERDAARRRTSLEDSVDLAIEMTFPASDPPAWMSSGTRPPAPPLVDGGEDRA